MVFVSQHTSSTFIFLKYKKKNKRAASLHTEQKPTPKKDGGKLNNIMCVIVFFSSAYTFGML
jgi:hypothetical protein